MNFKYYMPTKIILGKNCIKNNYSQLIGLGKKAVIITGKTSGKVSGALDDVIRILNENNINYCIFDRVENNPCLENVKEGGDFARKQKVDFIIGIGGGSSLDASKAVAVLAVNDIKPEKLYTGNYKNIPLPIVAVPTTAGTGSEVTPYSILTYKKIDNKKSFTSEYLFPKVAFLDAAYTIKLPYEITVNTALDAFCHSMEGYLAKKSTLMSDIIAVESIKLFSQSISSLLERKVDFNNRERLLYSSMLAGMVISHTGTTIIHSMGYPLTYFKGLPHGKANGMLIAEYLRFNYSHAGQKINNILKILNVKNIDELEVIINKLIDKNIICTKEEIQKFANISINAKNTANNPKLVTLEDEIKMFTNSIMQ